MKLLVSIQGRNFGLKVGVTIKKDNEAPLGPKAKGEMNREEERYELSQWGQGRKMVLL